MVNKCQRRNSRAQAGPNFININNYGPSHSPRSATRQPPMPAHGRTFTPSPHFPPDHHFQGINSVFAERARLLSSLQREDLRATGLLTMIADIDARLSSGLPMRNREVKWLKRDLAKKRQAADISARQERFILQRLGEVTLVIQQRERWWKVERERGLRAGIGHGARVGVEMGGNPWGSPYGTGISGEGAWNGRQDLYESQPQGYSYGFQGWGQQFTPAYTTMFTPPSSTESGGITGCNDWQNLAPVDSSSDWDMSRISGFDAMEQKSVRVARSDSMVELAADRRRAQSRMSMPDLSSRSWGCDYLGYQYPGYSPEMADSSDN
ncbi:hypothetical protein V492_00570 [Pseudogymnoascus sp. VKM F-4246]|nr:hypothetical protein V492_00570 [Pseudogymnoascus sp. VKM F-4246]